MKKIIPLFFLILCLFLSSCKKEPLTGGNLIYAGTWDSDVTELIINSDGSGSYYYSDGIVTKTINGRVIISGTQLKISATFVSKKYIIDQPPLTDTLGHTTMMLSGELFIKD